MPDTHPNPGIDLPQINTRNTHARHIVAGFASALPSLAGIWQTLDDTLADTAGLSALATWLFVELDRTRLDRANLRAAMRAALAAHADGDPDPMWYLRDELDARENPPTDSRGPR
jgi:hypothetical protein